MYLPGPGFCCFAPTYNLETLARIMIVTIDGYAGSGKSTAARRLAQTLDFALLNTGAMYRAVGLLLARAGIDIDQNPRDEQAIAQIVQGLRFDMPMQHVFVNGEDVTEHLATELMGKAASKVGTFLEVRSHLKQEQRRLAQGQNMVCEGRDQGTAVFPDAPVKFFLHASVEVRALRRADELRRRGEMVELEVIRRQIADRDYQDEHRAIDPLRRAEDAIDIDTSHMSADEVLMRMVEVVEQCRSKG